jgi:NAD(P)-dependent dehydrogenase (short-subunit alcohol dehydrogenase family)
MKPYRPALRALPFFMAAAGVAGYLYSGKRRNERRIDFNGRSVLISGGSRGLGLELARQFAREGAKLALLARDPDELKRAGEELARGGADVLAIPCDVRDAHKVEEAVAAVLKARNGIDVLVNVAGVIQVAPFENLDLGDFRESVDTHAWGPLHLIRAVAPHMQSRRSGRIVNISSIGGLVAVPHLLAYTMGKFALTGLSDGFRAELSKDGIYVTTVAPGLMRTGSHVNAYFKGQHRKEYAWFALSGANPLASTSAPRAAGKIIEACRYGDPRLIITVPALLLHLVNALCPGLSSFGTGLAARLLPAPAKPNQNKLYSGKQSRSSLAPSLLTKPSDRAIRPNNEG